jgi:hypothetical protein
MESKQDSSIAPTGKIKAARKNVVNSDDTSSETYENLEDTTASHTNKRGYIKSGGFMDTVR